MGIYVIRVPDIGEGIAEVELVAWHVKPGDAVVEDQHLADVMTDKATVEVPAHTHGKVLALGGAVGQVLAVGAELVRLEVEGEGNLKESSLLPPLGEGGDGGPPPLRSRTAYYLLFNGILGDRRPASGNVLTRSVLEALLALHAATPHPDALLVVYGEANRLGPETLARARITFKHIPYDVKAR